MFHCCCNNVFDTTLKKTKYYYLCLYSPCLILPCKNNGNHLFKQSHMPPHEDTPYIGDISVRNLRRQTLYMYMVRGDSSVKWQKHLRGGPTPPILVNSFESTY